MGVVPNIFIQKDAQIGAIKSLCEVKMTQQSQTFLAEL